MKTAVAMVIFNRPETTARVFAAVRAARPPVLLVVADGPRPDRPGEAERAAAARAVITEGVDWPCDLRTLFADENMGVGKRIPSGLDWVFGEVEEAIILEDDCVPHPTFFPFCEELLDRYRHDTRVGYIGGHSELFGKRTTPYSYHFEAAMHVWGWASWRRAWRHYDDALRLWPAIRDQGQIASFVATSRDPAVTERIYRWSYEGRMPPHAWDVKWDFACRAHHMLTVVPSVPLITNVGMGLDSTSTLFRYRIGDIVAEPMRFPLDHPPYVFPNRVAPEVADRSSGVPSPVKFVFRHVPPSILTRVQGVVRIPLNAWRGRQRAPRAARKGSA